ncbi:MAG: helix-turn-helix transcriptional regulator [Legionellales bacterium]|nr:helix-turn-helix transcriptional regulator [Legionellales bacterium]
MMKALTNIQIIKQGDRPAFVVVPYQDWLEITEQQQPEHYIPHEVVGLQLKHGISLIAAWRRYKKITQTALAKKIGVSQPALAQIEKADSQPKEQTLKKLAKALNISVEQLID